jgi:hypothetical protein
MNEQLDAAALLARIDAALTTLVRLHSELVDLKRHVLGANPVKDVLAFFDELWISRYALGTTPQQHYPFNRRTDPATVKRLLKSTDKLRLQHAISLYFHDRDKFLVENKHPFNIFASRLPRYIVDTWASAATDAEVVRGCTHEPRCASSVEHTRRHLRELRA